MALFNCRNMEIVEQNIESLNEHSGQKTKQCVWKILSECAGIIKKVFHALLSIMLAKKEKLFSANAKKVHSFNFLWKFKLNVLIKPWIEWWNYYFEKWARPSKVCIVQAPVKREGNCTKCAIGNQLWSNFLSIVVKYFLLNLN